MKTSPVNCAVLNPDSRQKSASPSHWYQAVCYLFLISKNSHWVIWVLTGKWIHSKVCKYFSTRQLKIWSITYGNLSPIHNASVGRMDGTDTLYEKNRRKEILIHFLKQKTPKIHECYLIAKSCFIYIYIYFVYQHIDLVGRVFTNVQGNWGSIPGWIIPKTQRNITWYLLA